MKPLASDLPPFFVVGSVRSGTTMLRLMLDHHPRICCFGEFEYAIDLLSDCDSWPTGEAFAKWLSTERRFSALGLQVDARLSYAEIAQGMFDRLAPPHGKPHRGAAIHRHYERILRLWPNARFVYLYRDGRDVASSCVAMGWAGNVWAGGAIWERAERCWTALKAKLPPSQWLEIANESLVCNPQIELDRICRFLGDEFDAAMLSYDEHSTYAKPDPALTEQWRRKLTQRQLRLIESRIGQSLVARGYPLSSNDLVQPRAITVFNLRLHDWLMRHRFRISRYGLRLWISEMAARKLRLSQWSDDLRREMNTITQLHLK